MAYLCESQARQKQSAFDHKSRGGALQGYFCPFVCFSNEVMERWYYSLIPYSVDKHCFYPIIL